MEWFLAYAVSPTNDIVVWAAFTSCLGVKLRLSHSSDCGTSLSKIIDSFKERLL